MSAESIRTAVDIFVDPTEDPSIEPSRGAVSGATGCIDFVADIIYFRSGDEGRPPPPSGKHGVLVIHHDGYVSVAIPWRSGRWTYHVRKELKEPDATLELGTIALSKAR